MADRHRQRGACGGIDGIEAIVHDTNGGAGFDLALGDGIHVDDPAIAGREENAGGEDIEGLFQHLRPQRPDIERIRNRQRATDMRRQTA